MRFSWVNRDLYDPGEGDYPEVFQFQSDRSANRLKPRCLRIVAFSAAYFPRFSERDFEGVKPWAGLRPVSPDGIPYLGQVPGLPNLLVASGHAMMGLSLGPVSGRLIADLLAGDTPFRPIEAMDAGRF